MNNKIADFPGFIIENTSIAVDFWPKRNDITHFFLTHAHTDHTKSLDVTWNHNKIYCSPLTKKLICDLKGIDERLVIELAFDKTHVIKLDETESFNVTLIDANHCPGAVMFLFEGY